MILRRRSNPALVLSIFAVGGAGCSEPGPGSEGADAGATGSMSETDDDPSAGPGSADDAGSTSGSGATGTASADASADSTATDGDSDGDPTGSATGDDGSGTSADDAGTDTGDTTGGGEVGPVCDEDVVCTGDTVWSRRWGNPGSPSSNESIHAVATDGAGYSVIAGSVTGVADFGAAGIIDGPYAGFVAKIDPDGDVVWARELDSIEGIDFESVALDDDGNATAVGSVSDDLIVDGNTVQGDGFGWDVLIAGYDADGGLRFANLYGSDAETDVARGVATGPDGRIAVTGSFRGPISFGGNQLSPANGSSDVFVAVFDAELGHQWSRRFGDAATQDGYGVGFDGNGDVVLAARNWGTIDFGGGPHVTPGLSSIAVAKLAAADGEDVWSRQFDPPAGISAPLPRLTVDDDGIWFATYADSANNVGIDFDTGETTGYFHVVHLDGDGNGTWSVGVTGLRGADGIVRDTGDGLIVVGALEGTADFGGVEVSSFMSTSDIFIAKYDAFTGALEWVHVVGDDNQLTNSQRAFEVSTDAAGHIYVGGTFNGIIDFGDGDLVSGSGFGGSDGFLAKLLP